MSRSEDRSVTVTVGEGVVTLRRSGKSSPMTATILGMNMDADGQPVKIWLDRIVHLPNENSFIDWGVHGAVSSILTRLAH